MEKGKRNPNWDSTEVRYLVEKVRKHEAVLFSKFTKNIMKAKKDTIWERIAEDVGKITSNKRSVKECKIKWNNIKQETESKAVTLRKEYRKTGGGENEGEELCAFLIKVIF